MRRVSYILVAVAVSFLLTGCGIYNKYEQKSDTPADAFGTDASIQAATGDSTIARMSWRESSSPTRFWRSLLSEYWPATLISTPHALPLRRANRR